MIIPFYFYKGGANMQFNMIPYNILNDDETVNFVETDIWSTRAKERRNSIIRKDRIIASSKKTANLNLFRKIF